MIIIIIINNNNNEYIKRVLSGYTWKFLQIMEKVVARQSMGLIAIHNCWFSFRGYASFSGWTTFLWVLFAIWMNSYHLSRWFCGLCFVILRFSTCLTNSQFDLDDNLYRTVGNLHLKKNQQVNIQYFSFSNVPKISFRNTQ